jgi:hypothetical protein
MNKPGEEFAPPETIPEFSGFFLAQIAMTSHLIKHDPNNSFLNFLFKKVSYIF